MAKIVKHRNQPVCDFEAAIINRFKNLKEKKYAHKSADGESQQRNRNYKK